MNCCEDDAKEDAAGGDSIRKERRFEFYWDGSKAKKEFTN